MRLLLATLLAAGCSPTTNSTGGPLRPAITNGTITGNDPAVVLVLAQGFRLCTGTLVAPRAVLTAAHCLASPVDSVAIDRSPDAETVIPIAEAIRDPGYDPRTLASDLAVLLLDEDAGVAPVPIVDRSLDALAVGTRLRVVGFGATRNEADPAGLKRSGMASIAGVGADEFVLRADPSLTCVGDSGGPALLEVGGVEALAGVTSSGDSSCANFGRDVRVDQRRDFIQMHTSAEVRGGCSATGRASDRGEPSGVTAFALLLLLFARRRRGRRRVRARPLFERSADEEHWRAGGRQGFAARLPIR